MHRSIFASAALCALLGLAGCAGAPTTAATPAATAAPLSKEGLRTTLANIAADRAALDKLMSARYPQLTGRKRELMVDQAAEMFRSPAFADRVYDLVAPKFAGRGAMPPGAQVAFQSEVREQSAALGMQLTLKGMTRLGSAEQEQFTRDAIALHRSVDAPTCRAMIDGKLPAARLQEIELNQNASRSDAEFEKALAKNRRAMQAELAGTAPVTVLTAQQVEAARQAWGRAILARSKVPAAKARFARYNADSAKASDADVCFVTMQYLEAMLDLRGNERIWQLQSFMQDTASEQ